MEQHKEIIEAFYEAFQCGDYQTMQGLYARESSFHDPVFQDLSGYEAGKMWEMLLKSSKDLKISLGKIESTDTGGTAVWIATYTFGEKRRPVRNKIQAKMAIKNGKIIRHEDQFDLRHWLSQALGWQGKWLGWMPFLRKQVQQKAQQRLKKYIAQS